MLVLKISRLPFPTGMLVFLGLLCSAGVGCSESASPHPDTPIYRLAVAHALADARNRTVTVYSTASHAKDSQATVDGWHIVVRRLPRGNAEALKSLEKYQAKNSQMALLIAARAAVEGRTKLASAIVAEVLRLHPTAVINITDRAIYVQELQATIAKAAKHGDGAESALLQELSTALEGYEYGMREEDGTGPLILGGERPGP